MLTRTRVLPTLVVIWLLIGVAAAWQRHYLDSGNPASCASGARIVATVIVGPMNYLGVNPKPDCSNIPQPSK